MRPFAGAFAVAVAVVGSAAEVFSTTRNPVVFIGAFTAAFFTCGSASSALAAPGVGFGASAATVESFPVAFALAVAFLRFGVSSCSLNFLRSARVQLGWIMPFVTPMRKVAAGVTKGIIHP